MKNVMTLGPSALVSEITKKVGGAEVHMITDLVKQIIVERVIPV